MSRFIVTLLFVCALWPSHVYAQSPDTTARPQPAAQDTGIGFILSRAVAQLFEKMPPLVTVSVHGGRTVLQHATRSAIAELSRAQYDDTMKCITGCGGGTPSGSSGYDDFLEARFRPWSRASVALQLADDHVGEVTGYRNDAGSDTSGIYSHASFGASMVALSAQLWHGDVMLEAGPAIYTEHVRRETSKYAVFAGFSQKTRAIRTSTVVGALAGIGLRHDIGARRRWSVEARAQYHFIHAVTQYDFPASGGSYELPLSHATLSLGIGYSWW